jgi:MFS family permease
MSSSAYSRPAGVDWNTLALVALTFALVIGVPTASVPVLFKEIAADLNLDVVQIGSVWGMISLGSIFVTPFGGILTDRLGAARSIMLVGILSGVIGATRAFSHSYATLMATTLLWGLVSAAIAPSLTLSASLSSSEQKQGLAQGFMGIGGGLGMLIGSLISATVVSPLVGGWRNVFFLYSGVAILTSLVWLLKSRSLPRLAALPAASGASFFAAFGQILRIRNFWLIGLSLMVFQGCIIGMQGYLPYYLEGIGWSVVAAGGAVALFSGAGTVGVAPFSVLSDRLGSRKALLYTSFLCTSIGVGLMSVVRSDALWVLPVMAGLFSQMNSALFATMCIQTVPKGASYTGTALGLVLSMGLVGRAFAPPLGNSLANISHAVAWPFVLWAGLGIIGATILGFIKEKPITSLDVDPGASGESAL